MKRNSDAMRLNALRGSKQTEGRTGTEAEPSEVRFRQWLLILLLTAGPILLVLFYAHQTVDGLVNPDAMDYAQLGRNLMAGHGLTTQILRPLALTQSSNSLTQPDVTHGPLYPFLLSLAFASFGAKDSVVQGVSELFYVLTVPLIFFLGQRMFHRTVGLVAALVFMTSASILEYAVRGTPLMCSTFLGTSLFLALYSAATVAQKSATEETKPARTPLTMAGILAALLYLVDPVFFWITPILLVALLLLHPQGRVTAILWFLIPWLLLALPGMIRFATLTGNPFFGLRGAEFWMGTEASPGANGYRMMPSDRVFDPNVFKAVIRKLFLYGLGGIGSLQSLPGSWMLLFVVPGMFFHFREPALNSLRRTLLACLAIVFLGSLFFLLNPALLVVFVPTLLIYAVAYLIHLIEQANMGRSSIILAGALLSTALLAPLAGTLVATRQPAETTAAKVAEALKQQSGREETSFSDQPWLVAWYADRPSIWIPQQDNSILDLRKQFPKARWLFLTPNSRELSTEWAAISNYFFEWDRRYVLAKQQNAQLPQNFSITKDARAPITEALEGFAPVPPVENNAVSAVMAMAP